MNSQYFENVLDKELELQMKEPTIVQAVRQFQYEKKKMIENQQVFYTQKFQALSPLKPKKQDFFVKEDNSQAITFDDFEEEYDAFQAGYEDDLVVKNVPSGVIVTDCNDDESLCMEQFPHALFEQQFQEQYSAKQMNRVLKKRDDVVLVTPLQKFIWYLSSYEEYLMLNYPKRNDLFTKIQTQRSSHGRQDFKSQIFVPDSSLGETLRVFFVTDDLREFLALKVKQKNGTLEQEKGVMRMTLAILCTYVFRGYIKKDSFLREKYSLLLLKKKNFLPFKIKVDLSILDSTQNGILFLVYQVLRYLVRYTLGEKKFISFSKSDVSNYFENCIILRQLSAQIDDVIFGKQKEDEEKIDAKLRLFYSVEDTIPGFSLSNLKKVIAQYTDVCDIDSKEFEDCVSLAKLIEDNDEIFEAAKCGKKLEERILYLLRDFADQCLEILNKRFS